MSISIKRAKGSVLFEVQLNLLPDGMGILTAKDVKGSVRTAASPEFGGREHNWSPEHLLLCAASSCFLATFPFFARELAIRKLQCDCIGKVQQFEGKYRFSQIDLFPRIEVNTEDIPNAEQALAKTLDHCIMTHSLSCDLVYHSQVLSFRSKKK
ncbi:MAG TPA: OsmC family protein [Chitinophagaceae bacterium]|nr:OsmC family protein [Chitinophagaceae bacterium]